MEARARAGLGRVRAAALALAAPAAVAVLLTHAAVAQTRKPATSKPARAAATKGAKPDAAPTSAVAAAMTPRPGPTSTSTGPSDAGVVESKEYDGGHAFKFSELDIEGRLKSPQLVYFLRRVRAEFTAGELGHRSFMREMQETKKEPSF